MKKYALLILVIASLMNNSMPIQGIVQVQTISAISWNHTGDKIAIGYQNGLVQLVDSLGNVLDTFNSQHSYIYSIAWNITDTLVADASYTHIYIHNLTTNATIPIVLETQEAINVIKFDPDGSHILVGISGSSSKKTLRVWEVGNGQLSDSSIGLSDISYLSFYSSTIAYGNGFGSIFLLDYPQRNILADFSSSVSHDNPYYNGSDTVQALVWSPDGNKIATGQTNGIIKLWDVSNSLTTHLITPLYEISANDVQEIGYNTSAVRDLAFSDNGNTISSIGADGTVRSWHVNDGTLISATNLGESITAADFNPDGSKIAFGKTNGSMAVIVSPVLPTYTLTLTFTATAIDTPTSTVTSTNTATATSTSTSTSTPTATPTLAPTSTAGMARLQSSGCETNTCRRSCRRYVS